LILLSPFQTRRRNHTPNAGAGQAQRSGERRKFALFPKAKTQTKVLHGRADWLIV
jgi:hypothetical protein